MLCGSSQLSEIDSASGVLTSCFAHWDLSLPHLSSVMMPPISLDTNYRHAVDFLVRNRIPLSFIVFSIVLLEDAIRGVSPHDVLSIYDHG